MSMPRCLTNPTLRQAVTDWGLVTLERNKNDGSFTIWKDGVNLGAVVKAPPGKKWSVCGTQILRTTRKEAIFECMWLFFDRHRAKTANDRVEGRDAASSRRVPSHDGLAGTGEAEKGSGDGVCD